MSEKKRQWRQKQYLLFEEVRQILGREIGEHELVYGHIPTIRKMNNAHALYQIVNILQKRHKEVYGKEKLFGSRYLYRRYRNENAQVAECA